MLTRAHSLLGVVPLSAFVLLHLYVQSSARSGREPWIDAAVHHPLAGWPLWLLLAAFAAHAFLGALRFARERRGPRDARGPAALAAIQAATGLLALLFIFYHALSLGMFQSGPQHGVHAAYARLWATLGRPGVLGAYLVGTAAVCLHLAHGWSRAAVVWGLARTERAVLLWRLFAGAVGFGLFFLFVQLLSHFAVGQPLV